MDWINLAQDREEQCALVNRVKKFQDTENALSITRRPTTSCLRTLLHAIKSFLSFSTEYFVLVKHKDLFLIT
jgi:hypothetical protein